MGLSKCGRAADEANCPVRPTCGIHSSVCRLVPGISIRHRGWPAYSGGSLNDEFTVGVPRSKQLGQVVAAIGGSPFGKGNAGQRCKRAVNVDLRKNGILLARFHECRPPHDERNTRSGFIQAVFAAAVDA